MKYVNAASVLPEEFVEKLQEYIQGGYLYIPAKREEKKRWGECSGTRRELEQRNAEIICAYREGITMDSIADRYYLSVHAVRKIIYQK